MKEKKHILPLRSVMLPAYTHEQAVFAQSYGIDPLPADPFEDSGFHAKSVIQCDHSTL